MKYTPSDGAGGGNIYTDLAAIPYPYVTGSWPSVGVAAAGYNGFLYAIPDLTDPDNAGEFAFLQYDPSTDTWADLGNITLWADPGEQSIMGLATMGGGLLVWNDNGKTFLWDGSTWSAGPDFGFTAITGNGNAVRTSGYNPVTDYTYIVFGTQHKRIRTTSFLTGSGPEHAVYNGCMVNDSTTGWQHYFGGRQDFSGVVREFSHHTWNHVHSPVHYWRDLPKRLDMCCAFEIDGVIYVGLGETGSTLVQTPNLQLWAYVPSVGVANPFTGELSV